MPYKNIEDRQRWRREKGIAAERRYEQSARGKAIREARRHRLYMRKRRRTPAFKEAKAILDALIVRNPELGL
jgi:hypothetical protein